MSGLTPHRFNRAVVDVIVQAREAAGLSKRELSDRLERSSSYIHMIEAGKRIAPTYELARIAYVLGITATELMARVERRLGK